jgi:hypothetical protein
MPDAKEDGLRLSLGHKFRCHLEKSYYFSLTIRKAA